MYLTQKAICARIVVLGLFAMDENSTTALISYLRDLTNRCEREFHRVRAMELALQAKAPALYQEYLRNLASPGGSPEASVKELQALRKALLQIEKE
jgi:hypothetical protein